MPEKLINTLNDLHQQLQVLQEVDEDERARLEEAIVEIQASLNRYDISSTSLARNFQSKTERFSHTHPHLTQTAGQFADMLSQMGI